MDTQLVTKQMHLARWAEMVQSCRNSGLSTSEWCRQNNIGTKCYYYRYKKVKEAALDASVFTEIRMPSPEPAVSGTAFTPQITLSVGNATLGISESTPKDLILQMMEILKDA